jgi:spermidine/putrescine transport system permease protein
MMNSRVRRVWSPLLYLTFLGYALVYLPLILVMILSFNSSDANLFPFQRLSLRWYGVMFSDDQMMAALRNSLLVGSATVVLALGLGVSSALALRRLNVRGKGVYQFIVLMPFILPEITTGLALLSLFILLGIQLSLITVIIGHTVYTLAIAHRVVAARLLQVPHNLEEASSDLGAGWWRTLFLVTLPSIRTAVITAGLLIFAVSFDETAITVMVTGGDNTLPMIIWGMMRRGFTPEVNAVATLVFIVSLFVMTLVGLLQRPQD